MRTLHGQFAPPFLPSQADPFNIHNINMAAVMNDDAQRNNDHQQPQSAAQAPSQQSLNVLVNTLLASPQPDTAQAPPLDSAQAPQSASRPSSANGAAPAPDQAQANAPQPASPTAQQQMSIQSLLTAARNPPNGQDGQQSVWNVNEITFMAPRVDSPPTANGQPSSSKRRLEDPDDEETQTKIRRIVQKHVQHGADRLMNMTTVICLHAAVAQKSYGSEKRFLCPPPLVRIEGPFPHVREQQMSMSIVSENGDRAPEQRAPLDNNLTASFKFLHVSGTAKSKSFQLSLEIAHPGSDLADGGGRPRAWATFESAPVTIISKPSKKTAKTRNISSCILAGGPVSLFNRINSQTVRTKYMTIDHSHLCASNVSWSAFNVNVLRRPQDSGPIAGPQPVTYGSEILLSDSMSGITTAPLIIRKVDKGKISMEDGGPVSQMQKIALQRVNPDGTRHYLSAAGPVPGTPGAIVAPPAPGMAAQAGTHHLLFQAPRLREEVKDGVRTVTDEVDDYLCWTIVGISKFQYTFFDALGQNNKIPEMPITPFPTLFAAPSYRPANNTVEMTVSNFFYENPKTGHPSALEVWLGDIGPLTQRVYPAPHPGPLTSISPFTQGGPPPSVEPPSASTDAGSPNSGTPPGPPRFVQGGPIHTMVVIELPPVQDIVRALQDEVKRLENGVNPPTDSPNAAGNGNAGANDANVDITGRTLPLLFIRGFDGVGYHSGRSVACENVFQGIDLNAASAGNGPDAPWLAAAQAAAQAAGVDGSIQGWTVRVL